MRKGILLCNVSIGQIAAIINCFGCESDIDVTVECDSPASSGVYTYAIRLDFPSSNNEAEYEALIIALQLSWDIGVRDVLIHTDSQLVHEQVTGICEVLSETLRPLYDQVQKLRAGFEKLELVKISRMLNRDVDAVAGWASTATSLPNERMLVEIRNHPSGF